MSNFMEILSGIPINSVLRERIELLKEIYVLKEKEIDELRKKLTQSEKEREHLLKQLTEQSETKQFVEYLGAYFKKNHKGEFEQVVYCPKCKLSTFDAINAFNCPECHWRSPFESYELPKIIKELNDSQ
ncbi:MAG: hypothetical protein WCS27_16555 [Victivallaceae bacterium]|jgi:rubrerythrin